MGNYDYRTHDRVELADSYGTGAGFRYKNGRRMEIGDCVLIESSSSKAVFKIRAFNTRGMRVIVSNASSGAVTVEPKELRLAYARKRTE